MGPVFRLLSALVACLLVLAHPAAAEILNSAVASGIHDGVLVQSPSAEITTAAEPASPSLQVTIETAIGGDVAPGMPEGNRIEFVILVENTGDIGLAGVRLALELRQGEDVFAPSDPPRYEGGDTSNPGILDRGETWRYLASYSLTRANVEAGGTIEARATGTAKLGARQVSDNRTSSLELPPLQGIARGDISLAHTPSTTEAAVGDQVDYTITVSNRSGKPLSADLTAVLSEGTALVPGSVLIEGKLADVSVDGQRVDFGTLEVEPRSHVSVRYLGEIRQAGLRGYHANSARIVDAQTLIPLVPPSVATLRTDDTVQGNCAAISILVYEDANRNGIADPDEPGVSGARVAIDGEAPLTTDLQGQYSSPCVMLPRLSGIDLRFELEEDTLAEGYLATTPNPMSLRLEPGGEASVTFGVAEARIVRLDLNAAAFRRNEVTPDAELAEGITRLISELARERSVLRLTYYAHREPLDLPEQRLDVVKQAILDHWAAAGAAYDLQIDERVVKSGG